MQNTTLPDLGNQTSPTNGTIPSDTITPSEAHPYLEFLVFMIPVYFFIIIALYKIITLMDNTLYITKSLQFSYWMKRRISYLISGIFALQFLLAIFQSEAENWTAGYKGLSICYLFGTLAWYLSAKLLDLESPRGLPQGILSHRLFWIANFLIACIRITSPFESFFWIMLINFPKVVLGFILALYAIGKPYDSVDLEANNDSENKPAFLRNLLTYIEGIFFENTPKDSNTYSKEVPLLQTYSRKNTEHEDYVNEFKVFIKEKHPSITHLGSFKENTRKSSKFRPSPQAPQVPEVHCKITRNEVREQGEDDVKLFYEVKTQIEDQAYTKLHKYANFLDLEDYVIRHCDPSKTTYLDLEPPRLQKIDFDGFDDEDSFINARVEAIEEYMTELVKNPLYLNERVLEFLGIQNEHKDAFHIYHAFIKKHSSKSRALHYFKPSGMGIEMSESNDYDNITKFRRKPKMPLFNAYCSHYQKSMIDNNYEYVFVVKDENDPYSRTWKLIKNYGEFKNFHKELEDAMDTHIPFFDQFVPKPTEQNQKTDTAFLNKRKIGLETYLDAILEHRRYYKAMLYEFLEYNKKDNYSSRSVTPRDSFYGESA